MVEPQVWTRKCFIDLTKLVASNGASSDLSLRAMTRDVTFDIGGRAMTATPLVNDGFIATLENEGKTTISLTGYATSVGRASGITVPTDGSIEYLLGLQGLFYNSTDDSLPISVDSDSVDPTPIRLAFLWENGSTASSATDATGATDFAYRQVFANGFITKYSYDWTGNPKQLEISADFEFSARNRFGFPNYHFNSSRGDAAIPALSSYNETNYGETVASRTW